MPIRLDQSCSSIVVICDECPTYARITRANLDGALVVALEHEEACHPDSDTVRDRINKRAERARRDTPLVVA